MTNTAESTWRLTESEIAMVATGQSAPQSHRIRSERTFREANRASHTIQDLREALADFQAVIAPRSGSSECQKVDAFFRVIFLGHEFNEAHQRQPREREKANKIMDRAAKVAMAGGRRRRTKAEQQEAKRRGQFQALTNRFHHTLNQYTEALREGERWEIERLNSILTDRVEALGEAGFNPRHYDSLILDTEKGVEKDNRFYPSTSLAYAGHWEAIYYSIDKWRPLQVDNAERLQDIMAQDEDWEPYYIPPIIPPLRLRVRFTLGTQQQQQQKLPTVLDEEGFYSIDETKAFEGI